MTVGRTEGQRRARKGVGVDVESRRPRRIAGVLTVTVVTAAVLGAAWASGNVAAGFIAGRDAQRAVFPNDENAATEGLLSNVGYQASLAQHDVSSSMDGTFGFVSKHIPGNSSCGCPACCGELDNVKQAPPSTAPDQAALTVEKGTEM